MCIIHGVAVDEHILPLLIKLIRKICFAKTFVRIYTIYKHTNYRNIIFKLTNVIIQTKT